MVAVVGTGQFSGSLWWRLPIGEGFDLCLSEGAGVGTKIGNVPRLTEGNGVPPLALLPSTVGVGAEALALSGSPAEGWGVDDGVRSLHHLVLAHRSGVERNSIVE